MVLMLLACTAPADTADSGDSWLDTEDPQDTQDTASSCPDGTFEVPEGAFERGYAGEPWTQPVRTITVSAFCLDELEVTNARFVEFLAEEGNDAGDGTALGGGAGQRERAGRLHAAADGDGQRQGELRRLQGR